MTAENIALVVLLIVYLFLLGCQVASGDKCQIPELYMASAVMSVFAIGLLFFSVKAGCCGIVMVVSVLFLIAKKQRKNT